MDNWIDKIVEEMGLGDTVPPAEDEPEQRISILEAITRLEFTLEGWVKVRNSLTIESQRAKDGLLQDIMENNSDDFKMFMAVIQVPYLLGKTLKYPDETAEKLSIFMVMALNIMATRGYELGRQSLESPGTPGGEDSG